MQKPERWLSLGEQLFIPKKLKCSGCEALISETRFFCSDSCYKSFKEKHPEMVTEN